MKIDIILFRFLQKTRSKSFGPFYSLFVLPLTNQFRVTAQQHFRNLPSVEFCRTCVDRS